LGREIREIAPEALSRLRQYHWPGNIRELQSVLKQALLHASGSMLLPAFLPAFEGGTAPEPAQAPARPEGFDLEAFVRQQMKPGADDVYAQTYRAVDRLLFTVALEFTRGNLRDAAAALGISRQTMRIRLRALGLQVGHTLETGEDAAELTR
jgi:two-component system nitrogen regulation response regulator GlnG